MGTRPRAIAAITDNTDFLDPFVVRFIKNRKWIASRFKNLPDRDANELLHAKAIKYDGKKQELVITLLNGVEVPPRYLSSGQQELLYLILIINYLKQTSFNIEYSPISFSARTSIYIEEPEAHLFPKNQKAILEFITDAFRVLKDDRKRNDRFFITTHSPYILNVINNMLYKGHIMEETNKCSDETKKHRMQTQIKKLGFPHLAADEISAHFIQKNVVSMINVSESGLYLYEDMIEKINADIDGDYKNVKDLLRQFKEI